MTITARTARDKGRAAENALAAWLQTNGFPDAERSAHKIKDRGDIAGVPRCCIQIKHYSDPMRGLREAQAGALVQAHGRRPVAVVRLPGVGDPAQWWAATTVEPFTRFTMHGIGVGPRCTARTIHLAIDLNGAAWRDGWWLTTVERLFAALPGAVTS